MTISSNRIYQTTIRQSDVQAVAQHWASGASWSVTGVTATGDQVLIQATGPNPAPGLAALRHDHNAAGPNGLDTTRRSGLGQLQAPGTGSAAVTGIRGDLRRRVITSTDEFLDASLTGGILPILVRPGAIQPNWYAPIWAPSWSMPFTVPSRSHSAADGC